MIFDMADGSLLYLGDSEGKIYLIPFGSKDASKEMKTVSLHRSSVLAVCAPQGSKLAASCESDGTIIMWFADTRTEMFRLQGLSVFALPTSSFVSCSFSSQRSSASSSNAWKLSVLMRRRWKNSSIRHSLAKDCAKLWRTLWRCSLHHPACWWKNAALMLWRLDDQNMEMQNWTVRTNAVRRQSLHSSDCAACWRKISRLWWHGWRDCGQFVITVMIVCSADVLISRSGILRRTDQFNECTVWFDNLVVFVGNHRLSLVQLTVVQSQHLFHCQIEPLFLLVTHFLISSFVVLACNEFSHAHFPYQAHMIARWNSSTLLLGLECLKRLRQQIKACHWHSHYQLAMLQDLAQSSLELMIIQLQRNQLQFHHDKEKLFTDARIQLWVH